jgi:hypothetical protein
VSVVARACAGLLACAALASGLAGPLAGIASAALAVPSGLAVPLAPAASRPGDVSPAAGAAVAVAADRVSGSRPACTAFAYAAIEKRRLITATPAACAGLAPAEVNQAVGAAIRMTLTKGTKSARRRQTSVAVAVVRALITTPGPAPSAPGATGSGGLPPTSAVPGGPGSSQTRLGGVSELAAKVGALLAWLAAAASGGLVLARWLRAGGNPLRRTATAAPPGAILGHAGGGLLGLLLWAAFLLSGWAALAWIALGLLLPVAGAGMAVLVVGLPRPGRPGLTVRRPRIPVFTIFAHGLFAATALLLVLMAAIGA